MSEEVFILPIRAVVEVVLRRIRANERGLRKRHILRRAQAPSLAEELLRLPRHDLPTRLRRSRGRFYSRPLVENLTRKCAKLTQTDSEAAVRTAEAALAVLVAVLRKLGEKRRLWLEFSGLAGWHDLRGLVLAQLANVHRTQCLWEESHQGFREAYAELGQGTGDPLVAARLRCLHASLLRDRGSYQPALQCLALAEMSYRNFGHAHEVARTLLKRAEILDLRNDVSNAIQVQIEAIGLLDEAREPTATLAAFANLAEMYRRGGKAEVALSVLDSSENHLKSLPSTSRAWITWHLIRGRVNLALRSYPAAEDDLRCAYQGFHTADYSFDFALAGLGLMKLYLLEDRRQELLAVAGPTLAALQEQELVPEALGTVAILANCVANQTVESRLIDHVSEALARGPAPQRSGERSVRS